MSKWFYGIIQWTIISGLLISLLLCGYYLGIRHATMSEGYLNNNEFVLLVDGNEYIWEVE